MRATLSSTYIHFNHLTYLESDTCDESQLGLIIYQKRGRMGFLSCRHVEDKSNKSTAVAVRYRHSDGGFHQISYHDPP